jgi:hypothetical protein
MTPVLGQPLVAIVSASPRDSAITAHATRCSAAALNCATEHAAPAERAALNRY